MSSSNCETNETVPNGGRLAGKVALVTAATEGIGFAIAKRLATDGAKVVISSRKQANVDRALESLRGQGLSQNIAGTVCHVGKAEDRQRLVAFALETFGAIDALVSNAAASPVAADILDTSEAAWDKIFDTNLKSAWQLTKLVVPHMRKRGQGSIVYISSVAAYNPQSLLAVYGVSKTAILGLTRATANQLAASGIRVNCVCPGFVETKLSQPITSQAGVMQELLKNIPMGRIGQADEIAGLVSYLVSRDASYMTGECLCIAGGMQTKL
ncbi:Dehydrogenase/reductase SDR family member 4 [Halotydeus destructor]|nr:Dehydrogenase/reductase SDR family member 4 [Halotydeus destructor]